MKGLPAHDRKAIQYLMQVMKPIVVKVLLKKSAQHSQAEDIYMDALEALYREISAKGASAMIEKLNQPRATQLQTYVIQICLNLFFKSLRRNKVQTGVTSAQEVGYMENETISHLYASSGAKTLFDEKLKKLDESCREVLALFFQQVSMKDIADKLGTTEQYAKKKKFNCKSKLVELIRDDVRYQELKI